jgi:hypothetical protein
MESTSQRAVHEWVAEGVRKRELLVALGAVIIIAFCPYHQPLLACSFSSEKKAGS